MKTISSNLHLAAYLLVLTLFSLPTAFAQYTGSSQFFNLEGTWKNEGQSEKKRVLRLDITTTIVNTYRATPYFALGDKELPFPAISLEISEKDLSYITNIGETKCIMMPMRIDNQDKIKIYSLIPEPGGAGWADVTIDYLVRDNMLVGSSRTNFDINSFEGYWVNEWEKDQLIPRFRIVKDDKGKFYVKVYRLFNGKVRHIGEHKAKYDPEEKALTALWRKGSLNVFMRFRAISFGYTVSGIDMVIEEIYTDGVPKNVYRQFFVKDPEATKMAAAELMIEDLMGEWTNFDVHGRTKKMVVHDTDLEIWVNCEKTKGCLLGKKEMKPAGVDVISATYKTMATVRKVEIMSDLTVNSGKAKPTVIVLSTMIEDVEGLKPPKEYTEVFRRKSVKSKKTRTQPPKEIKDTRQDLVQKALQKARNSMTGQ